MRQTFDTVLPLPLRTELERSHILKQIEENPDIKLFGLFAPSGFGKTTLMAKVARASLKCVIWLSLGDQVSSTLFCQDLVQEILAQNPHFALTYYAQTLKQQTSVIGIARALAKDINLSDHNFMFFFDRVDHVESDVCRWLESFMASLGEGHQVFLSGYGSSPLRLTPFVSEGTALIFSRDQLAYTTEETEIYLKARGYEGNARWVHDQLEGWPAGIALVASGANPYLQPVDMVIDALEVLPTEIRSALCELSILETWSEDLALAVGVVLPRGWLQTIRRTGLPISPLSHGVVRPHRLLREVLEQELRLEPVRAQRVYLNAARHVSSNQDHIQASKFFLQAKDIESAVLHATKAVSQLSSQWEPQKIRNVLEVFAIDQLSIPLQAALGQAMLDTGDLGRGETLLHKVVASGDPDPMTLYGLALIAARRGKHDLQLQWLEKALAIHTDPSQFRKILRLKASAKAGLGLLNEALEMALDCVVSAEEVGDVFETASALDVAEYIYALLGRSVDREHVIERAIELFRSLDMPLRTVSLTASLAEVYVDSGRSNEALILINSVLQMPELIDHPLQLKLLETRGDCFFSQLLFAQAADDFEAAFSACQHFGREGVAVRLLLKCSDVARQLGDTERANSWYQRACAYSIPLSSVRLRSHFLFATGQSLFEDQQFTSAKDCFEELVSLKAEPDLKIRAKFFMIELQLRQGLLTPEQWQGFESQWQQTLKPMLLQLDIGLLVELQNRFRQGAKSQVKPNTIIGALQIPIPPKPLLKIRTLGSFEVRINQQMLVIPITKSMELLVWLALHGQARRDEIIDALWDGSNERRHAEYFRFAVRRLRSSLMEHPAIVFNPVPFEGERYQLSDQFDIEVDVLGLSNLEKSNDELILEEKLLQLSGGFMQTLESEWAQTWRDNWQQGFSDTALQVAERLLDESPRRALLIYEHLIKINPFNEEAQTAVVKTCQRLGEDRRALRFLRAYEKMLREEMQLDLPRHLAALTNHLHLT